MHAVKAAPGALMIDSLPFSKGGTAAHAAEFAHQGVRGVFGYLGSINALRLGYVLDAGLSFNPVTFAGEYLDGPSDEIAQLKALAIPQGTTVFVDLENERGPGTIADRALHTPIDTLKRYCAEWATGVVREGWEAGIYFGSPQPFTEEEMWELPFTKYWKGMGAIRDRFNKPAEPFKDYQHCRGWDVIQVFDTQKLAGIDVDYDIVQRDYRKDTITTVLR